MAVNEKQFGKVGVLMGGPSTERAISLKSGKAVYEALKQAGVDSVAIDIRTAAKEGNIRLLRSHKINCAFLALHGRFGEDGQIQKILETMKIPYTGSGVLASRLAMDKAVSRKIFEAAGLKVPKYRIIRKGESKKNVLPRVRGNLAFPLVVKPATHGSSIGLSIIDKDKDLENVLKIAFKFDKKVIIEEYIAGRELTVGILDKLALPVIEIIPKRKFFDYKAKYKHGLTEYVVPAKLKSNIAEKTKKAALSAHKLLGCFGCSRVDIILNKDNIPFILEVNTIPGLTNTSLLPKAAKVAGIDFSGLCIKLIKLAYSPR